MKAKGKDQKVMEAKLKFHRESEQRHQQLLVSVLGKSGDIFVAKISTIHITFHIYQYWLEIFSQDRIVTLLFVSHNPVIKELIFTYSFICQENMYFEHNSFKQTRTDISSKSPFLLHFLARIMLHSNMHL